MSTVRHKTDREFSFITHVDDIARFRRACASRGMTMSKVMRLLMNEWSERNDTDTAQFQMDI